jgi:hypothetical protein
MGLFDFLQRTCLRLIRLRPKTGFDGLEVGFEGQARVPVARPSVGNPLEGKRLRYLIGKDGTMPSGRSQHQPAKTGVSALMSSRAMGTEGEIVEVGYDVEAPPKAGIGIKYCNLFDENNTGAYGPYLHTSDTAAQYDEGQIDPEGPGWDKNLEEQLARARSQGFVYIELDNPDAYRVRDVLRAVDLASRHRLKVIAKNPGLMEGDATAYVAHPNVFGIIVEKGGGDAAQMDRLRKAAGKPSLPVWFVAFGDGKAWAQATAKAAADYRNMSVTYSSTGEYGNSVDVLPA